MFQNVERYIEFITTNKMSQAQFILMYLIYRKKYACIEQYKKAFPTDDGTMIGEGAKEDLIKRGFIEKVNNDEKADSYILTDKFLKLFLKDRFEAAEQIWNLYPGYVSMGGNTIPLTTMDRYRFANIYAERIDYSVDEHLEVIKDVKFGVDNNLLRTSIEKFVMSEAWLKIRPIRLIKTPIPEVSTLENDF